ncbi:hypothetical protein Drorol1_Dr00002844 [Drosera rotundifolia]
MHLAGQTNHAYWRDILDIILPSYCINFIYYSRAIHNDVSDKAIHKGFVPSHQEGSCHPQAFEEEQEGQGFQVQVDSDGEQNSVVVSLLLKFNSFWLMMDVVSHC